MGKPNHYSHSQIELFNKCPYSYYLKYFCECPTEMPVCVQFGSDVHKALEDNTSTSDTIIPYINAVNKHYIRTKDYIVAREHEVNFNLGKYPITCRIDALTSNKYVVDYKVTSAPSYLKNKIGYQLPLYYLALKGEYTPKYIFLKRGRNDEFDSLSAFPLKLKPHIYEQIQEFLINILDHLETCWKTEIFPPTFSGCDRCFMSSYCKYYLGGNKY